ncbi:MAG: glycoside hydrolase family 3 protein [Hyphomicrobiales bacterium]|nr:MAG: glycoside hydrolase family 3 protein [Hyphomicrobiales bacterium]
MRFDHLTRFPFNLDAEALAWVEQSFSRLTPDEKVRQLFNLLSRGDDPVEIEQAQRFKPGGITRHMGRDVAAEQKVIAGFNAEAPVPVLVSADLEGSRMSLPFGTEVPNPLAAIDDVEATRRISTIMAHEARAAGMHWSFTPVLDVNAAFRSAIVATRGYGSDLATIERHALAQLEAFQAEGIAATLKHWPGEGYDDRDQHLVTTINPLAMDEWEAVFGRLYRKAIAAGALSVMSGHIALPSFIRALHPDAGLEAYRPASISRLLNIDLLREKLGFNGLIVSDATAMAGLGSWSHRRDYLPEVIASGCDVILFTLDAEQDAQWIRDALEDGRLSWERVDDAVVRQLGLKAKLGLHQPQHTDLSVIGTAADRAYAAETTRRAPTLVKDVQALLPLDPEKHRRVLFISPGIVFPFMPEPLPFAIPDMLRSHGFDVTLYDPSIAITRDAFDLVLYAFGDETLLTRSHIFVDWLRLTGHFGKAMQRPWHDIPTLMVSFGFPYLLYDAPRVPTYINAYSTTESMQRAVVDALLGNLEWNRNSPVDPFCGLGDAKY